MADGGAHMRERGLGDIHTAIDLDKAGQFDEAIKKYTKGIEFLITSNKYETNERTKEMVKARAAQYLTRLEQLKKMQDEGGGTADSPKPAPPGGVVQAKKGGGQGASQDVKDKSAMREALMDAVQMEVPNISFDDVAGLEGAKAALKEAVIKPALYPQLFRGERKPWKGILLYGPPGTGKSYLAKALANESKIEGREDTTFFSVSSSDLVSKYVGESERLVRNLFELAREHKPSIIFVDEIDSLCTARSDQESDSARRIKTEFLVQMDGVGKDQDGVLLLGATNLPWGLDQAVRRRFQKRVYIPLPDVRARAVMFKVHTRKQQLNTLEESDYAHLAAETEGFSGSDIQVVVREALMEPIRNLDIATHFKPVRALNLEGVMEDGMFQMCKSTDPHAREMRFSDIEPERLAEPPLTMEDFIAVVGGARASVSQDDLLPFQKWTEEYGQDGSEVAGQRGETRPGLVEGAAAAEPEPEPAPTPAGGGGGAGGMATGWGYAQGGGGVAGQLTAVLGQLAAALPEAQRVAGLEARLGAVEGTLQQLLGALVAGPKGEASMSVTHGVAAALGAVVSADAGGVESGGSVAEGQPPDEGTVVPPPSPSADDGVG